MEIGIRFRIENLALLRTIKEKTGVSRNTLVRFALARMMQICDGNINFCIRTVEFTMPTTAPTRLEVNDKILAWAQDNAEKLGISLGEFINRVVYFYYRNLLDRDELDYLRLLVLIAPISKDC